MKRMVCTLLTVLLILNGCGRQGKPEQTKEATKQPVRVAVIDTGFSHLGIPSSNQAPGHNYLYPDQGTEDTYGHGTAIGSVILSVCPEALLVPLVSNVYEQGKIRQVDSRTFAKIIKDAVDIHRCSILNISAGMVLDQEDVREAVVYAHRAGCLIIASAGNDYRENPGQRYYPAAYEQVLAVGALNADEDGLAPFTQRGEWVDLYAPGTNISITTLSGGSRESSGTSYAGAFAAGAAAKLLSENPRMDGERLTRMLMERTHPVTERSDFMRLGLREIFINDFKIPTDR